jgi:hypothetical protein
MTQRMTAWTLSGLLALATPAWVVAQDADTNGPKTVKKEDVKTWTEMIDGKEWSMRRATPTHDGDTGLFRLSSAYVLPKGKASFSLFRDNLDRDPKDIDFSIHGLSVAFGATSKLEIFGNIGLQNRVNVDAGSQAGFYNDLPGGRQTRRRAGRRTGPQVRLPGRHQRRRARHQGAIKFGTAEAKGSPHHGG